MHSCRSQRAGNGPYNRGLRLDHYCLSESTVGNLRDCFVRDELVEGDHAPTGVQISLPMQQQSESNASALPEQAKGKEQWQQDTKDK